MTSGLALGWAAGSQFDPRVATAFLGLHNHSPNAADVGSREQRSRLVGAGRPHRSGASTKPAPKPTRHAWPSAREARSTNTVLTLVLVPGLAHFVPVAGARASRPPPARRDGCSTAESGPGHRTDVQLAFTPCVAARP